MFMMRLICACFAICCSMWSKKPRPVVICVVPVRSRFIFSCMFVSFVVRVISAVRSPANSISVILSHVIPCVPRISGVHPRFCASWRSVSRSPIT